MKYILPLILAASLYGAPSGVYVEGNAGTSYSNNLNINSALYNYDRGFGGALALGFQYDLWRFEIESSQKQNKLTTLNESYKLSGNFKRESNMFNLYYSGYNKSKFVSTVGLGFGMSNISTKEMSISGKSTLDIEAANILTYQASFSVGYMFDEDWTLALKYLRLKSLKYDIESVTQKGLNDNILSFGLRYLF